MYYKRHLYWGNFSHCALNWSLSCTEVSFERKVSSLLHCSALLENTPLEATIHIDIRHLLCQSFFNAGMQSKPISVEMLTVCRSPPSHDGGYLLPHHISLSIRCWSSWRCRLSGATDYAEQNDTNGCKWLFNEKIDNKKMKLYSWSHWHTFLARIRGVTLCHRSDFWACISN